MDRSLGQGDGEATVGDIVRERAPGSRVDDEADEGCFRFEVETGRRSGDGAVPRLQLRARERRRPGRGDHDRIALLPATGDATHVRDEPDTAHHRCGVDRSTVGVVVQGDVARDDRQTEGLARPSHPFDRLRQLPADLRLLRVAEVEAVREPERLTACTGDVPGGLEDGGGAAEEGIERADSAGAVQGHGETAERRPQAENRGIEAGAANGARLDELVVAARHERARTESVGPEQVEQELRRRRQVAERNLRRGCSRVALDDVPGTVVREEASRDRADRVSVPERSKLSALGDLADHRAVQLPAIDHGFDLASRSGATIATIRSWDSEIMTSHGSIPSSRCGTRSR